MRFQASRTALSTALKTVLPAIPKTTSTSALYGIKIEADENGIRCTASSLDETIVCHVEAADTDPGVAVVNASRLARIVTSFGGAHVLADNTDSHLELHSATSSAALPLIPTDSYPQLVTPGDETDWMQLTASDVTGIRRVLHAASTDTSRGLLCGVSLSDRQARATDSYRLAQSALSVDLPDPLVIDATFLRRIVSATGADHGVRIAVEDREIYFAVGDTVWATRQCSTASGQDGGYPSFGTLIRAESEHEVTLPLDQLTAAIRRTSSIDESSDDNNPTCLWFDDGVVRVDRVNREIGTIEDEISIDGDKSAVPPVALRPDYFGDLLDQVESDEVTLGIDSSMRPVIVTDGDWMGLIMPVRTTRIP